MSDDFVKNLKVDVMCSRLLSDGDRERAERICRCIDKLADKMAELERQLASSRTLCSYWRLEANDYMGIIEMQAAELDAVDWGENE